jgi:hypothetical protein
MVILWRIRAAAIRALGLKECGAFGGMFNMGPGRMVQRWCHKPFGHEDSCAYDDTWDEPAAQPGFAFRAKFRGWGR